MGEVVVGDPYAWIPRSFAIRRTRSMCVRSDTNTARRATLAEQLGDRFQRLEGRAPLVLPDDRARRHLPGQRVLARHGGFGGAVALLLAAGDDQ